MWVERVPTAADASSIGKSDACSALWRARDSRTRAAAEATSGLDLSASAITRVSSGSSKRFHHRERSCDGAATGNPPAFFQAAGNARVGPVDGALSEQAPRPSGIRLEQISKRGCDMLISKGMPWVSVDERNPSWHGLKSYAAKHRSFHGDGVSMVFFCLRACQQGVRKIIEVFSCGR